MISNKKRITSFIILVVFVFIMALVVPKIGNFIITFGPTIIIDENKNSSGVQLLTQNLWCSWSGVSLDVPFPPSDSIGYVNYQLKYGEAGVDYFEIYPEDQIKMEAGTREERNQIMWNYLYNYRYVVSISNFDGGYIMFTTKKSIANNRDLFLAIDGNGKGAIDRGKIKKTEYKNEYLFDMENFVAGGYSIDFDRYIKNNGGKLVIGCYVGEVDNTVEKITIVKKNN